MITHVTKPYRMKKLLLILFSIGCFFFLSTKLYAQSNQTVPNGGTTTTVNFAGSCTYNWVNSDPSIGLAASGTGDIPSFTAVNTGKSPVTSTITATPVPNGFAYIANYKDGTVSVINTAINAVVTNIPVGSGPFGVAVSHDGSKVYITNRNDNTVSVISTLSNTVIATISVGTFPWGVSVSPNDKYVYVTNSQDNTVSVIDATINSVINTINVDKSPIGVSVLPDGSMVYVACYFQGTILAISTATNKVVTSIPVSLSISGVIISPDGGRIYVSDGDNNTVYVINTTTNKVISTIAVRSECFSLSISSDGSRLYVANQADNTVSIINTVTNKVVSTITTGLSPTGVSLSADGDWLYVTNQADNTVSVISTVTKKTTSIISVGQLPTSFGNFIVPGIACSGAPVVFTITVNPTITPADITTNTASGVIAACVGTASASPAIQQFTVSGSNLTAAVTATAPAGFEVSLTAVSSYGKSVTLNPSAGNLSNITIYVRSAAGDAAGPIAGNVVLSSTDATNQNVAVSGVVNALPTVNKVNDQTVTSGTATTAINFTGTGNTFTWTNDTPGIGLAASGTGNIASFIAVNKSPSPVKATVVVTPYSAGYAYVANTQSNDVSVINTITSAVVKTIGVGSSPLTVAVSPDDSKVYVANSLSDNISVISTATNAVIATVSMQVSPSGMIFSPDGSKLYVASIGSNIIYIINTSSNAISGGITGDYIGFGMAITPDGKTLYVADMSTKYVSVFSTVTNSLVTDILVGGNPYDLVMSPDGTTAYAINDLSGDVSVIKTATNTVATTFKVGVNPYGAVVSPDGKRLYVANQSSGTISVINTADQSLIKLINTGGNPSGVSLNGDVSLLYVTNHNNEAIVINTATNSVLTKVTVGTTPISMGNFITRGTGCAGDPTNFTITVNPALPLITTSTATGNIISCAGTASLSPNVEQFTVSGSNLSADISATAPAGFEISLSSTDGYANSLAITPTAGTVSNTVIYVRSSATAAPGNISGSVILSSANVTDQPVAVSGVVNAIPMANTPGPQTPENGSATAPVNFTGTASTFSWANDTPGIGLAASGTGDIPSFTAVNNTMNLVTATITVTPLNSTGCNGMPIEFTITVNPSPASLTANAALTPMTTIYGSPSSVERFTVSGTAITSGILITPPAGFEVSLDEKAFSPTVTINGTGNIYPTAVFIRLAASTHVGNYSGNVIVSTNNAADATIMVPVSTVTRASLTITADNKTRPFGVVNPTLTVTYSGFVNNDSADQLTTLPTLTTDATISSAVGQYAINVNHDAASPDYMFNYNPGILTITPVLSPLSIPNTFTPNGDGINDTWVIKDLEYYPKSTINIFNRWGQKLFTSIGYPIPWDGNYQGKALSSGTYYYIIDPKNGQALLTGWVAIIR